MTAPEIDEDDVEAVARDIFSCGKRGWPEAELREAEDRNWRECVDEARAAITALMQRGWRKV